jgi:pimeloyl-ACP methyl ester carboxylesterase/tetratricopeptide (TPR) repeat protein
MANNDKIRFLLPGTESTTDKSRAHGPASRGGPAEQHELLTGVTVRQHFDLSAQQRAAEAKTVTPPLAQDEVLAIEMEGGLVLYTSAGRLADDLRRIDPKAEKDGAVSLEALRRRTPATRGLGDWVIRALSVLGVDEKWLIAKAAEKAKEWGGEALVQGASWAGTKAMMWTIEEQLEREPELYAWNEDGVTDGDLLVPSPPDFSDVTAGTPMLVFIHGTGSSTRGSFGELRRPDAAREWLALREKFGKHVYGFEHRTFSQSPIENALELARKLPVGARLSIVTHSRGGLVGDLLCAAGFDGLIDHSFNRTDPRLALANEEDRKNLKRLGDELAVKEFIVERYVRVACPAQGTLLASSHIDAFLSALLHLIGMVPGLAGSPLYAVVKRVVLQIAKNRTDPSLVPGVEAMLPNSPLAALVGRAKPQEQAKIAVVAGDIEGGGVLKRLGVFLTDYLLFEEENNDLVVDSESMFGGIARDVGRYVFDQGEDVSHFRYFANARTRRVLQDWLTGDAAALAKFQPIRADEPLVVMQRGLGEVTGARPVVLFLPGIMGSHLQVKDNRIWFDFFDLARGKLTEIAYDRADITPNDLFRMFYGNLCNYLAASYDVILFAYDWRKPLEDSAALLVKAVDEALERTQDSKQPVRLMTHSMGGLVVRALIAKHSDTWKKLVEREGGRWVMLGTPNRGSHGTVESLLGLSGTMRKLAMLHPPMGLQAVVDLVASFPGAVQLLPRPGFRDTGDARHDYYAESFWTDFKQGNDSPWFGRNLGTIPAPGILAEVKQAWDRLGEDLPNADRIAYVAGYGHETPCGIEREEGKPRRLRMVGTLNGDGTVTHDSGLLDVLRRNQRVWYMNADHAGLTDTKEHFPALVELLERGETERLPQARPTVRGAKQLFRYEPGPVLYPTEQELKRALIGGRKPARRQARAKHTLKVCCRAMDLRHAIDPILVGHYEGDAISGAEMQIDRYVVDNRLTLRHHLDAYAGPPGSVAVVLNEPNEDQARLGLRRGAVVIGLGNLGELKATGLAAAVRQGALRYLLQLHDRSIVRSLPKDVGLASLLLGYSSTTHISIEDSVAIVIRGVMEANRQFAETSGSSLRIERLEFVELFEDVAISAAKAVRDVVQRLGQDADRLGFRIEPAQVLECGEGMRQRLEAMPSSFGYWPRMIVTGADEEGAAGAERKPGQRRHIPLALRYVFLSMRARAETVEQQRQPGLVDELIERSVRLPQYRRDLARSLFHLLVAQEFKEAARQADSLVLVVDGYTANLPWEMLVADDEPLIKTTKMVRQLASGRFRHLVRTARDRRAYVIGNPSAAGYYKAFPKKQAGSTGTSAAKVEQDMPAAAGAAPRSADEWDGLPNLPGAEAEARAVADLLSAAGYQVTESPSGSDGIDVINRLYEKPYRILHLSAHGVYRAGEGEIQRTGVVLSNGLVLTAAEIGALEAVPDLVFLSCCHVGRTDAGPETAFNRLAYSIASELIEGGARAVVAAGWAVDDDAARHFAECFYQSFLRDRRPFGDAVYAARVSTYEQFPESNTWGAFQAYGEPSFVMDPDSQSVSGTTDFRPVAPQEIVARIDMMRSELAHTPKRDGRPDPELAKTMDRLLRPGVAGSWSDEPEVLYALGRLYSDAGDFARARQSYEKAIALEDKGGRVPVVAIEQLANMEARQGGRLKDQKLIDHAIDRLLALERAVGGFGAAGITPANAERCALLGGAYKRLASLLTSWLGEGSPERPGGMRQALEQSALWYERGEGDPERPDFSAYNCQNRLALQAVLGTAKPEDAKLAERAGEIAAVRYVLSRNYFDLVMQADGLLIARLIDGSLKQPRSAEVRAAEDDIVGRYEGLRDKLPENSRWRDSVLSQIELLAKFFRAQGEAGEGTARSLGRIHAALAGNTPGTEVPECEPEEEPQSAPPSSGLSQVVEVLAVAAEAEEVRAKAPANPPKKRRVRKTKSE